LWTINLVEWLVYGGKLDEAAIVASETTDPAPRILLAAGGAQFGKAIAIGHDVLPKYGPDAIGAYWAFVAAGYLGPISLVVERPSPDVGALVARYLVPEPNPNANDVLTNYQATIACLAAPRDVAKQCLARVRVLAGGPVGNVEGLLEGAEKFVDG